MGLRFRKSIKLGPVRINLSKSGIGYSVGVKGARVTKKAGGGYRSTVGLPGSGLSYSRDFGGRSDSGRKPALSSYSEETLLKWRASCIDHAQRFGSDPSTASYLSRIDKELDRRKAAAANNKYGVPIIIAALSILFFCIVLASLLP